jgi:hypothetical protein
MKPLDWVRIVCLVIILFFFASNELNISLDFIPVAVKAIFLGFVFLFAMFFKFQLMGDGVKGLYNILNPEEKEEENAEYPVFKMLHTKTKRP